MGDVKLVGMTRAVDSATQKEFVDFDIVNQDKGSEQAGVHLWDRNGKTIDIMEEGGNFVFQGLVADGVEKRRLRVPVEQLRQAGIDVDSLAATAWLRGPNGTERLWEWVDHKLGDNQLDHVVKADVARTSTASCNMFCGPLDLGLGMGRFSGRSQYCSQQSYYVLGARLHDERNFFKGADEIKLAVAFNMSSAGQPSYRSQDTAVITMKRQPDGSYAAKAPQNKAFLEGERFYSFSYTPGMTKDIKPVSLAVGAFTLGDDFRRDTSFEQLYQVSSREF